MKEGDIHFCETHEVLDVSNQAKESLDQAIFAPFSRGVVDL